MIISIRGANGAGKSHLTRRVVESYATGGAVKLYWPESSRRVRSYGTIYAHGDRRLFVPGHYDIANGGIDTLDSLQQAYDLIYKHHAEGMDVLYEGQNHSDGMPSLLRLYRQNEWDCRVVLLNTTAAECVRSMRERGHNIREDRIVNMHSKIWRDFDRFCRAGLKCRALDREQAYVEIMRWLTEESNLDNDGDTTRVESTSSSV